MTIPLQPVNLEPYARNPMITMEQVGQGLDNMQSEAQRTAALRQQMAMQKQLAPGQLQMQKDQLEDAQEQAALEKKYPAMAFGPSGQNMALLDYMQGQQGGQPPQASNQQVPQNVPQQPALMGIPSRPVSPSFSGAQAPSNMGIPLSSPINAMASQGASFPTTASAVGQMRGASPAIQMPMGGTNQAQQPSNVGNQVLGNLLTTQPGANVPMPSQMGGTQSAVAPQHQDVNAYAQNFVDNFQKRTTPYNATDFGIHMNNPQQQSMANAMVSRMYPMSYGEMASNMLPMRAWEYMPSADRNSLLAMGVGYGLTRDTANNYFARGGTLQGLAQHTGIPVSKIQREFAPTTSTISTEQRAGLAANALNAVDDQITGMIAPYAGQNVFGFNSKEMSNLVSKTNPQQLSDYLGASMARREQIMLQIQRAGGRPTEQQTHELAKLELANSSHLTEMMQNQMISPSIYHGAMDTFNRLGNDMYQGQHHYVQTTGTHKVLPSELTATPPVTKGAIGSPAMTAPKQPASVKTGADFKNWYNGLSVSNQQAYRQQVGQ